MKIVVNRCFGGFSVSEAVLRELGLEENRYGFLSNEDFDIVSGNYEAYRSDERLIAAIEKVGIENASGSCAGLAIVEVPDGVEWFVDNYDGSETIREKHRTW